MNNQELHRRLRLIIIHLDFLIAIILTLITIILKLILKSDFLFKDYSLLSTIFVTIFSVNFTVFALSKFLLENYPKIKETRIKKNIDIIFRAPLKSSLIGLMLSVIFYIINVDFLVKLNFVIYFLFFYCLVSSYYVFKFIYTVSIKHGKS